MISLDHVQEPTTAEFLIGFTDIRGFARLSKEFSSPAAGFAFFEGLVAAIEAAMAGCSGRVLKYIGDASLIVFPGEDADAGVRKLLEVKEGSDAFISSQGFSTTTKVSAHFGEATLGPLGAERRIDIMGDSVSIAARAADVQRSAEFVITPEAFRRLEPDTRKLFHKYTPQIVYTAAPSPAD